MKLLHIVATPRLGTSTTLQISNTLLETIVARHPDTEIEAIDLFRIDLPALAGTNIEAKYTLLAGRPIDPEHAESWAQIENEIARFLRADAIVITAPMWNFSIPYVLKYYLDCIVQPGYLFRFGEGGMPMPLVSGKRVVVVTSSGSDYSPASPLHALDFHEPYLRAILGFVGITDVSFIHSHAADVPSRREAGLELALAEAREVGDDDGWAQRTEVAA